MTHSEIRRKLEYFPLISATVLMLFMVILRVRKEVLEEQTYATAILGLSVLVLLSLWIYDHLRINHILGREVYR